MALSHYALLEVKGSGFVVQTQHVLGKKCACCQRWLPETPKYFYKDGKKQAKGQWRPESYCIQCRKDKEIMTAERRRLGQPTKGTIADLRKAYLAGERTLPMPSGVEVIFEFDPVLSLDKAPANRDHQDYANFMTMVDKIYEASEAGNVDAKDWIDSIKVKETST